MFTKLNGLLETIDEQKTITVHRSYNKHNYKRLYKFLYKNKLAHIYHSQENQKGIKTYP